MPSVATAGVLHDRSPSVNVHATVPAGAIAVSVPACDATYSVPSGPSVGEPVTGPPTSTCQRSVGALTGAGPAVRPRWRRPPPNSANGGGPVTTRGGAIPPASGPAVGGGAPGSTQLPATHTRAPLQSESLPHGLGCTARPAHAASDSAATTPGVRRITTATLPDRDLRDAHDPRTHALARSFENRSDSFSK